MSSKITNIEAVFGKISIETLITGLIGLTVWRMLEHPEDFANLLFLVVLLLVFYMLIWWVKKEKISTIQGLKEAFVSVTKALDMADANGKDYLVAYSGMKKKFDQLKAENDAIRIVMYCPKCGKNIVTDKCVCEVVIHDEHS